MTVTVKSNPTQIGLFQGLSEAQVGVSQGSLC